MSVTQQLVRLNTEEFKKYLEADEFDGVLSYDGVEKIRYLDLGWDASFFRKLLMRSDDNHDLCKLLEGMHRLEFDCDVAEQPLYLTAEEVNNLVEEAEKIDVTSVLELAPKDVEDLNSLLKSDYVEYPDEIFRDTWAALLDFYKFAKSEGQLVVNWWD
ncbi:MAG: hypothetical protein P8176_09225 [Gammaproteobacteria bacterium]